MRQLRHAAEPLHGPRIRVVDAPAALRAADEHDATLAALLTDIDGTLIDTNDLHTAAWCDAFRAHGVPAQPDVVAPLIGMGADKIVPLVARGLRAGDGLGKAIVEDRKRRFLNGYLREARPAPGARALLLAFRETGVRIYVATSAQGDEREALLRRAGVSDLVEPPPRGAQPSKPDPDVVQTALDQAQVAPSRACVLGDTPYDIEAAAKAGVTCVAVRCGGWDDRALAGAAAIYDDPADILRHLDDWALPAAGSSTTR